MKHYKLQTRSTRDKTVLTIAQKILIVSTAAILLTVPTAHTRRALLRVGVVSENVSEPRALAHSETTSTAVRRTASSKQR